MTTYLQENLIIYEKISIYEEVIFLSLQHFLLILQLFEGHLSFAMSLLVQSIYKFQLEQVICLKFAAILRYTDVLIIILTNQDLICYLLQAKIIAFVLQYFLAYAFKGPYLSLIKLVNLEDLQNFPTIFKCCRIPTQLGSTLLIIKIYFELQEYFYSPIKQLK